MRSDCSCGGIVSINNIGCYFCAGGFLCNQSNVMKNLKITPTQKFPCMLVSLLYLSLHVKDPISPWHGCPTIGPIFRIITWLVGCGLTLHSAIFQLYSDRIVVQFPNLDLLPGTQHHGQLGVLNMASLPRHGHLDV